MSATGGGGRVPLVPDDVGSIPDTWNEWAQLLAPASPSWLLHTLNRKQEALGQPVWALQEPSPEQAFRLLNLRAQDAFHEGIKYPDQLRAKDVPGGELLLELADYDELDCLFYVVARNEATSLDFNLDGRNGIGVWDSLPTSERGVLPSGVWIPGTSYFGEDLNMEFISGSSSYRFGPRQLQEVLQEHPVVLRRKEKVAGAIRKRVWQIVHAEDPATHRTRPQFANIGLISYSWLPGATREAWNPSPKLRTRPSFRLAIAKGLVDAGTYRAGLEKAKKEGYGGFVTKASVLNYMTRERGGASAGAAGSGTEDASEETASEETGTEEMGMEEMGSEEMGIEENRSEEPAAAKASQPGGRAIMAAPNLKFPYVRKHRATPSTVAKEAKP